MADHEPVGRISRQRLAAAGTEMRLDHFDRQAALDPQRSDRAAAGRREPDHARRRLGHDGFSSYGTVIVKRFALPRVRETSLATGGSSPSADRNPIVAQKPAESGLAVGAVCNWVLGPPLASNKPLEVLVGRLGRHVVSNKAGGA